MAEMTYAAPKVRPDSVTMRAADIAALATVTCKLGVLGTNIKHIGNEILTACYNGNLAAAFEDLKTLKGEIDELYKQAEEVVEKLPG